MKNFIFLWLMTTFQQVQSCTKNEMYLIGGSSKITRDNNEEPHKGE